MNNKKKLNRDPIEVENSRKRAVRIQEIREKLCNDDNSIFAAKIGVSKQYASGLCTASERITDKTLEKILKIFPNVSRSWLYFDDGEMLRSDNSNQRSSIGDNSGIIVQHGGGGDTYNNNSDLMQVVISQQQTIQQQAEQITLLLNMLNNKS